MSQGPPNNLMCQQCPYYKEAQTDTQHTEHEIANDMEEYVKNSG